MFTMLILTLEISALLSLFLELLGRQCVGLEQTKNSSTNRPWDKVLCLSCKLAFTYEMTTCPMSLNCLIGVVKFPTVWLSHALIFYLYFSSPLSMIIFYFLSTPHCMISAEVILVFCSLLHIVLAGVYNQIRIIHISWVNSVSVNWALVYGCKVWLPLSRWWVHIWCPIGEFNISVFVSLSPILKLL